MSSDSFDDQDPHEMMDPLSHPLLVAALDEPGPTDELDNGLDRSAAVRKLNTRELAQAA